jgi:hypothetical protein
MTVFDERFLTHRLRATSLAGMTGVTIAAGIWFYRFVFEHRWSWDVFAIAVAMGVVKQGLMLYYRFTH